MGTNELRRALYGSACASLLGALFACGGRPSEFDAAPGNEPAVGLGHAVVLPDDALSRVVVLQSDGVDRLQTHALPVGKNRVSLRPDVSGERLLVLSAGVQPRRQETDERPSLSLIDTLGEPALVARYELSAPFAKLALDPQGQWAVLSGAAADLVTNPNQLVLVDLNDPNFVPFTKTIRSFGSAPTSFQFSATLDVPGGARRFLIAETNHDVTLVDLDHLDRPEITIGLPRTPSGAEGQPLDVVVDPGTSGDANDARLAIRLANDPNIVLVTFTPAQDSEAGFNLTLNLVDLGSPPSAIDFVTTDAGLRLAALVPDKSQANLIEPASTRVEHLSLPAAFDQLRKGGANGSNAAQLALLWSQNTSSVAIWSLDRTNDQTFRSIDVLSLDTRLSGVLDVPGDALGRRKLLQAADSRFFVLDLVQRQSFPMLANGALSLSIADDGLRAWAFAPNSTQLAKIDLATLEPTALQIERPISGVFDIATRDDTGRVLCALEEHGTRSATLLNAVTPDSADTRYFPDLLLGAAP